MNEIYEGQMPTAREARTPLEPLERNVSVRSVADAWHAIRISFHALQNGDFTMNPQEPTTRLGKIRFGLAALLLGLPLPIVIIAFLWGGCTR